MKQLRESLAAQGVHTLIAQFTDVYGVAKGKFVSLAHLDALEYARHVRAWQSDRYAAAF